MKRRRSIEYGGVGQSGYAAGRHDHDHDLALEEQVQTRNPHYPHGTGDEKLHDDLDTDDRWTGRGGIRPSDDEE